MTTTTLPTPVLSGFTRGWDGKDTRSLKAFFPLTEPVVETLSNGTTKTTVKGVEVTTMHSGSRKEFVSVANQVTKTTEALGTSTAFWLLGGVTLDRAPVARYSAKGLKAVFEQVLDALPGLVESSASLNQMFTVLEEDPS